MFVSFHSAFFGKSMPQTNTKAILLIFIMISASKARYNPTCAKFSIKSDRK
jgi:hypothetical protein